MLIVGERINASRKSIAKAIERRDTSFIQKEAKIQDEAGADYIDLNAALYEDQEAEYFRWIVEAVQNVTEKPLSIDSADPATIKSVISLVKKAPIINSTTLEPSRLDRILPLVKEYGAKVIGLCQSEKVIPKTLSEKMELADQLVQKLLQSNIPLGDLYIDPLIFPLAADTSSAQVALEAIEMIMKVFPDVHTICGLSNVSHGLPQRKLVNRTYLTAAVSHGLDAVILDPTDKELYSSLKASIMVAGRDEFCTEYIKAFREGRLV